MKKLIKVIIAISLLLVGCSKEETQLVTFMDDLVYVEFGDTSFDPVQLIIWGNFDNVRIDEIDYYVIGKQELTFYVEKNDKVYEYMKTIEIIDTNFPEFIESVEKIEIEKGGEIILTDYFRAIDKVEGEVEIRLNSDIDESPGNYSREIVAEDSNGNQTRVMVTIIIRSPKPSSISPGGGSLSGKPSSNGNNGGQLNSNEASNEINTPILQPTSPPAEAKPVDKSIQGVKDIRLSVGSTIEQLQKELSSVYLNGTGNISINYTEVNLSVPGTYTVYYTASTGDTATCSVVID